ncbi:MAG TPA: RluA family pseudouridine synthase [Candidatus Binataceae bacterium]|nr:RluA family pseudouridine synthase [Candidatus Binataceae bacterium]
MADASGRERLDQYLVRMGFAASRRAARELVDQRRVSVNGRRPHKGDLVGGDDRVEVEADALPPLLLPDAAVPIDLIYSDAAVLVVNKPGLMPCHPLRRGETGTLMNGVVARFPEVAAAGETEREGGLVHRLDNGTSGAILIARSRQAQAQLRGELRSGQVTRRYRALVAGGIENNLDIDEPIGHRRGRSRRMSVASAQGARLRGHPRPASTQVEPVHGFGAFTLVVVVPRTGSRHQIRVHLANAGYPIVGDTQYGGPPASELPPGRFWLHLEQIEFESPAGGRVIVKAPLPAELLAVLESVDGATV